MKAPMMMPMSWLTIEKVGTVSGVTHGVRLFQSNVGQGLMPRPLLKPTMLLRLVLSGAIHEIQLKMDSAWKMKPGKK